MTVTRLESTDACPVCGGCQRLSPATGHGFNDSGGPDYLKHAAERIGLSVNELVKTAKVIQCATCHSWYCDPWLNQETASHVFTAAAPEHIAGWASFEHWVSSDRQTDTQATTRRLYDIIRKRIGPISSYAEFGCPFRGFLLQFKAQEETPARRVCLFAQATNRPVDIRWTRSARLHHAASRLANVLVATYHRLRTIKERCPRAPTGPVPQTRVLFTQETVRAWGNNCVRYGGSCRYFAHTVLGADVLPFDASARKGLAPLDLLGIFDSLDHADDPLGVIRRGLALSRHVVTATHHAACAGKQHQYAFDESFPRWLAGILREAIVDDLTTDVIAGGQHDYNYLLISRKSADA